MFPSISPISELVRMVNEEWPPQDSAARQNRLAAVVREAAAWLHDRAARHGGKQPALCAECPTPGSLS